MPVPQQSIEVDQRVDGGQFTDTGPYSKHRGVCGHASQDTTGDFHINPSTFTLFVYVDRTETSPVAATPFEISGRDMLIQRDLHDTI